MLIEDKFQTELEVTFGQSRKPQRVDRNKPDAFPVIPGPNLCQFLLVNIYQFVIVCSDLLSGPKSECGILKIVPRRMFLSKNTILKSCDCQ